MSADASITITGTVKSEEDLEKLLDAIYNDEPTLDWGASALTEEDEIREVVVSSIKEGNPLQFNENDRPDSEFGDIEATCREIGLSYVLEVDVEEEGSDPGHTVIWTPGMDEPLFLTGSSFSEGPFVDPKKLLPLVKAGKTDEVMNLLSIAADPGASLPKTLKAAFDLELAQAPSA